MALSKLAIGLIAAIATVGAVGGITAGVVVSNKVAVENKEEKEDEKLHSDQPAANNEVNVASVLNSITEKDIVFNDENIQKQPSDIYAFNLGDKKLEIKHDTKIPQGYKTSIEVKKDLSITDLNNGKLKIVVKVENTTNKQTQEKELLLTTFKQIDETFKKLFDNEGKDNATLFLISSKEKANEFITINKLNTNVQEKTLARSDQTTVNGLTTWIKNSQKAQMAEGVSIEGKVKVKTISKSENGLTIFELVSATDGSYLKLTKTDKNNKLEALVESIKTTNLLADEVKVIPVNSNTEESAKFEKELIERTKKNDSNDKTGFKVEENKLILPVKKEESQDKPVSDVAINSYVLKEKATQDNKISLSFNLSITFGTGTEAITFQTANKQQAQILQDAGFSFHIYTRWLENKDEQNSSNLKTSDLEEGNHKLNKYFVEENYSKPANKPEVTKLQGELNAIANNNFYVLGPIATGREKEYAIETKDWMNKSARNYITFADYSYISASIYKDTFALKDKVLYTANLSLINIQKETVQQEK